MKKILILGGVLLLGLILLTACSNLNTDNESSNSDSSSKTSKIINASSLITREDAGRILGVDMLGGEDDEIDLEDKLGGHYSTVSLTTCVDILRQ